MVELKNYKAYETIASPSTTSLQNESVTQKLDKDDQKLYELIKSLSSIYSNFIHFFKD